MTTRKKYSKEFKLDAVSLVLDQRHTRGEAARSLDTLEYISIVYNGHRLHPYRGYMSPNDYEFQLMAQRKVA